MSELNDLLTDALRARMEENTTPDGLPLQALWNQTLLPCAAGDAKWAKQLGIGGFGTDANLIMIFILEDVVPGFKTAADLNGKMPVAKQTVQYQGKGYRINDTTIPPGLAFIALALIDPSKGV